MPLLLSVKPELGRPKGRGKNDPANAARFIEKGLLSFPQEQTFAQVALYYAEQAGYTEKALEILRRAKSNLQYDVEPYIAELINIQGAI